MAFQPVPNGIEVKFIGTQAGQPVINVFNVDNKAAVTPAALAATAALFETWWRTSIRGGIATSYSLDQIITTDISVPNGNQNILVPASPRTGAVATASAAANAALVVSWRTAQIGRSFRGRTYVGGLPTSAFVSANAFDPVYAAGFAVGGVALINALTTAGKALAVLSRYSNGVLRVTGLLTEIVAVIVNLASDSSRKRLAN